MKTIFTCKLHWLPSTYRVFGERSAGLEFLPRLRKKWNKKVANISSLFDWSRADSGSTHVTIGELQFHHKISWSVRYHNWVHPCCWACCWKNFQQHDIYFSKIFCVSATWFLFQQHSSFFSNIFLTSATFSSFQQLRISATFSATWVYPPKRRCCVS